MQGVELVDSFIYMNHPFIRMIQTFKDHLRWTDSLK